MRSPLPVEVVCGPWILCSRVCTSLSSGYSVLNIVPSPHFRDSNTGAYIGQQVSIIELPE